MIQDKKIQYLESSLEWAQSECNISETQLNHRYLYGETIGFGLDPTQSINGPRRGTVWSIHHNRGEKVMGQFTITWTKVIQGKKMVRPVHHEKMTWSIHHNVGPGERMTISFQYAIGQGEKNEGINPLCYIKAQKRRRLNLFIMPQAQATDSWINL
jgi:hypothetical protein